MHTNPDGEIKPKKEKKKEDKMFWGSSYSFWRAVWRLFQTLVKSLGKVSEEVVFLITKFVSFRLVNFAHFCGRRQK